MVISFGAGVIAATFVCPLDVIKTRLQVHGLPRLASANMKGRKLHEIFHPLLEMCSCVCQKWFLSFFFFWKFIIFIKYKGVIFN